MVENGYTPTWGEIEAAYVASRLALTDDNEDACAEELHRWLAGNNRQVAERAWDQGWLVGWGRPPLAPILGNPYRGERNG